MRENDIAVVGMACVLPKAANLNQYWSNLVNGVDAVSDIPQDRWRGSNHRGLPPGHEAFFPTMRGAFLPSGLTFDPLDFGVMPNIVRHGDPDQFLLLSIVDAALRDAGIKQDDPVRKRTDVVIGRGGYPTGKLVELTLRAELFDTVLELIDRRFPEMMANGRRNEVEDYLRSTLSPNEADNVSTGIPNIAASRTANRLNLQGAAYMVDAACASALMGVEQSTWRLRQGLCDVSIASGLFLNLNPTFFHVFTRLGAISHHGTSRPFDKRADGLMIGEGGGAVVLKRMEDAVNDGDRIYCIIKGVGSASDGRDVDVLAPSAKGQVEAMRRAYADAAVDPDTIGYLEAHGTGTVVGDLTEIDTIKQFFGTSKLPPTSRSMGSVKSMIGHTMPASGIASLIKVALSLSNKIVPPTINCEHPRPELEDAPFYVNTQTRPWVHNGSNGPRRAGVNTFGFGGVNVHAILEEVTEDSTSHKRPVRSRPIRPGVSRPSELAAFSGQDANDLQRQLNALTDFLDRDETEPAPADISFALWRKLDMDLPCKLAFIYEDMADLRRLIDKCVTELDREEPAFKAEETYYGTSAASFDGKVAFIFPGMGFPGLVGNYPDHLMELALHYPDARAEFDFFEERDRHPDDQIPTSAIFCPPACLPEEYRIKLKRRLAPPRTDDQESMNTESQPEERYLAAMGVTLSNWIGWVLLKKFQIPVHMVTGQSQGEMTAVCAAGVSDFHETAPAYWKVLNVNPKYSDQGRLAFAWASEQDVAPHLEKFPGTYVAIHLGPEAIILGGEKNSLMHIADALREEERLVTFLPYPPIHTPCLSHLKDELIEALESEDFELKEPELELYSSITSEQYPNDPRGIRETLMMNVDSPLRVWQTIQKMYIDGARFFVQVGGGHMAAHLGKMLPEGAVALTAALDVDTRSPLTQLNHLCAQLFIAGVPLTLDPLHEYRTPRVLDLNSPQAAPVPSRTALPLRLDWTPIVSPNVPPKQSASVAEPTAEVTEKTDEHPVVSSHEEQADDTLVAAQSGNDEVTAIPPTETSGFPSGVSNSTATFEKGEPEVSEYSEPRMPLLGEVVHHVPGQELVMVRRLDLNDDRFLSDHLFVYAPGVKPEHECLPILPMTVSMELIAEAAAVLSPGLGLIGYEQIRASQWIGLEDRTSNDIRIEAATQSFDETTGIQRVSVTLYMDEKKRFSGTVLFASEYRQDLDVSVAGSESPGEWPYPAEEIYANRHMFHGPSFHCITQLTDFGNPGYAAELTVLPKHELFASNPNPLLLTDPCLMDGIGQMVGLWCQVNGWYVLPTGVEKVEIYRPTPPLGTRCPVRLEVVQFDTQIKQTRANVEVEDGEGNVWMRLVGWSDWIFRWPHRYTACVLNPQPNCLAEPIQLPGLPENSICTMATQDVLKGVDIDWAGRIFLHSTEMADYWEIPDKKLKRQHICSRTTLKDAVRIWTSWNHGTELSHPAETCVLHDERGRPYVLPRDGGPVPYISLSHSENAAIAVACGEPVGIDMEPISRDTRAILSHFATEAEQRLIDELCNAQPDEAWETRLWCAKEAVGKVLGIGLEGRPKDFQAVDIDEQGQLLMLHVPTGHRFSVNSCQVGTMIVAYTTAANLVAEPAMVE